MQLFNDFPEQPFQKEKPNAFPLLNIIKSSNCGLGASVFERKRGWMGIFDLDLFQKVKLKRRLDKSSRDL